MTLNQARWAFRLMGCSIFVGVSAIINYTIVSMPSDHDLWRIAFWLTISSWSVAMLFGATEPTRGELLSRPDR